MLPKKMALCCCLLLAVTSLFGQARKISLKANNVTIATALAQLEEASGFSFFYKNAAIDKDKIVSISAKDKDILAILEELFAGTGIKASIMGSNIILSDKRETMVEVPGMDITGQLPKGYQIIAGQVIDQNGESIIGASIVSDSDKTVATVTDLDGRFYLIGKTGDDLAVSALGYKSGGIHVQGNTSRLVITLQEDILALDEVIFVGYGLQRRSDVTGAISSVNAEQAASVPTTSVPEMLRGLATGVQVKVGNASPGGSSSILIRGRHSLSGGNSPLYIVDGVPMDGIDYINSNDIASIEVLKDASSQSIYGARAANGVILITTKRGSAGKTKVTYDGYAALQTISRNFEFYNGEQWAAYRHEAFYNAFGYFDEDECFRGFMKEVKESGEYVDWEKVMIKPAFQQKHDILIQAGSEKTKVAAGVGFYGQDGMVQSSEFQRLSGRVNLDQKLSKTLSFGVNMTYYRSWRQTPDGTFNSFVTVPPLAKIYDENGHLLEDVTEAGESHTNPLWNIQNSDFRTNSSRLMLNVFADWQIAEGLSYRLNTSMSQLDNTSQNYYGLRHTTGKNTQGKADISKSNNADYLLENILNYNHDFSGGHHFDATLMQSINVIKWNSMGFSGTGFSNDDLSYNAIGQAVEYGHPSYGLSSRQLVSFLGRVRYSYKDRYLFSAAVRVDGSSVFGKDYKYGVFPSAAFAWRINNEPFMQDASSWLNNLKLRLSWGQVGNQGISPYTTLGGTTTYYYRFGDDVAVGYLPETRLYNPNLKWETSTTTNIGLDFGLWRDRVNGSIELYDTETTDLLVGKSINQVLGYTSQMINLGRVQNKGIEVTLNTVPVSTRDFSWNVGLSFSRNINKIKRISGEVDEKGNPVNDVNNNWFIGHPVSVYYDYQFDGIWQTGDDIEHSCMPTAKPGFIRVADTTTDGKITHEDRVIMSRDPDWFGTVSTQLRYKGFDIGAALNISMGGTFFNSYLTAFGNGGDLTGKRNGIVRNYWTENNPSQEAPAPNYTQAPAYINALGYQDASYLRLRSAQIGYTFSSDVISRIQMQALRFYISGTNLWYHTKVLGYGPEQTPGSYPEPRTILFGVKATF